MSSLRLDHVFSSLYLAKSHNAQGHGQQGRSRQEQAAEGLMFSPPTPWPLPRKFDSPRQKRGYTKCILVTTCQHQNMGATTITLFW